MHKLLALSAFLLLGGVALASDTPAGPWEPESTVINIRSGSWHCRTPQDGTIVIVHNPQRRTDGEPMDGAYLDPGCTGRISALIVKGTQRDGVKVHRGAHDIVVESGLVKCAPKAGLVHQDGIQAMGGNNVTFSNFEINCPTGNNGGLWVEAGDHLDTPEADWPSDIICDNCDIREKNAAVHTGPASHRSGAKNSTLRIGTSDSSPRDGCRRLEADDSVNDNNLCVE